jgi:hypothetical protein
MPDIWASKSLVPTMYGTSYWYWSEVTGKYPGVLIAGIPQCLSKITSYLVFAMSDDSGKSPKVQ